MARRRARAGPAALVLASALVLAATLAASPAPLAAADARTVAAKLPRAWCGRFHWRGDTLEQRFAIRFSAVTVRDDGRVAARGAALIIVPGRRFRLWVSATIDPRTLRIVLREHREIPDSADFTTDGAHRGALGPRLETIRATWTQNRSGEKGDLALHAVAAGGAGVPSCGAPSV